MDLTSSVFFLLQIRFVHYYNQYFLFMLHTVNQDNVVIDGTLVYNLLFDWC